MSRKRSCTNSMERSVKENNNVETYILVHECRVCLQAIDRNEGHNMMNTWKEKWKQDDTTIAQDFERLTNVQISQTDDHTKFICNQCLTKLKMCLLFIKMAQHSDDILHKKCRKPCNDSPDNPVWPKPIQIDKVIGGDHLEVEVKQEILSDDENVMETEELDNEVLMMDIKVEPEEYQYKETPDHGTFPQDNEIQVNGDQHKDHNIDMKVVVKEEPLSEQDDVEMAPDMPLECMLCMKTFHSVSGLKAHVIAQHSYVTIDRKTESKKEMFSCNTCRRNFFTHTDLIVHETCHYKHACYMCNNKFDTFSQLTKHRKKCPKNAETVTRVKTLEDVKRPSPEPQVLLEDKESKQSKNVPQSDEINSTNDELKIRLVIGHSMKSNSMEIDKGQETETDNEQIKLDDKEVLNNQILESKSLNPHSPSSELNNPNTIIHSPESEPTVPIHSNENNQSLDSNNSTKKFTLEFSSSLSYLENTNGESNDIKKCFNSELVSVGDNSIQNVETVPNINVISADSDKLLEISGEILDHTAKTTVIDNPNNTESELLVKSNDPNSESIEINVESILSKEIDSPLSKLASPHTETNSPDTEITSLHPKTDSPDPKLDSSQVESINLNPIESISQNLEVSPDLESNNLTEGNSQIKSNTSLELSSAVCESVNENKTGEISVKDPSTDKEVDSDMKILLEIHSIDKKVSIENKSDINAVELNEDNVLQ